MEEFAGKTAVVTGAGSGMGKAFALRWGAEGMNVVIGDIQQDALDATVAELEAAGVPVLGLRTDVSKLADIEALADAAEAAVREDPPGQQQRRRRGVPGRADLGGDRQGLGLDAVGQPDVGDLRHPDVRAADARARRARARGQHLLDDLGDRGGQHVRDLQARDPRHDRGAGGGPGGGRAPTSAATGLCPGIIATNLFHGSRNRPAGADQRRRHVVRLAPSLRDHMHAVLSKGMPPSEVADTAGDGGAGEQAVPAHRPRVGQPGSSPGTRRSWPGVGPAADREH